MGELVVAGVPIAWLSDPQTRIPQVLRMAKTVARARIRETARMATAIGLAFDENPHQKIAQALKEE